MPRADTPLLAIRIRTIPLYLNNPNGIAVSQDLYVYVADTSNNRIVKFNQWGGCVGAVYLSGPFSITIAPDGTIWSTSFGNLNYIYPFDANLNPGAPININSIAFVAAGPDGAINLTTQSPNGIGKFLPNNNAITGIGTYYSPSTIAVSGDNFAYVFFPALSEIDKYDSNFNPISFCQGQPLLSGLAIGSNVYL